MLLSFAACDGGTGARTSGDAAAVQDAGDRALIRAAQGGRLRSADGLFELYVPPGSIAQDTEISVRRLEAAAVSPEIAALSPVSGVYAIEPDGLRFAGDGAYARFRFDSMPPGLVSQQGAERSHSALVSLAQPAAGGAVTPQPGTITQYDPSGAGVQVLARIAHLSSHFVSTQGPGGTRMQFGVDFGQRSRGVGYDFVVPARVAIQLAPRAALARDTVDSYLAIDRTQPLLTRNQGDTLPLYPQAERDAWVLPNIIGILWRSPILDNAALFNPPAELYCQAAGSDLHVVVGASAGIISNRGERIEIAHTLRVSVENIYDCLDGLPPPDVQRDARADAIDATDATDRLDVTDVMNVADATSDLPIDASMNAPDLSMPDARDAFAPDLVSVPDVADASVRDTPPSEDGPMCPSFFTRCGRDCADLSSDFDHCGACGNVCPARPNARRLCRDYRCVDECLTNRGDCDGDPSNGCETSLTTRLNCGGCGRMPPEVCDGVDNDCDGAVDESCPTTLVWSSSGHTGPTFGGPATGSDTTSNIWTGTYFNPLIGLCGTYNSDGTLRALRGVFSAVSLVTDRSTPQYTYSLRFTELDGMWTCETATGGGTPGGTAFSIRCPPGMAADGVLGRADTRIGQIQLRCARFAVVAEMGAPATIRRVETMLTPVGGSGPGSPFSDTVPDDSMGRPGVLRSFRMQYRFGVAMSDGHILNLRPSGGALMLN